MRIAILLAVVAAGATLLLSQSPSESQDDDAGRYTIDAAHSFVSFRTTHKGVGAAYGRFNKFSGSFVLDGDVEMTIEAASIDTNNEKRDGHLRSPDFLDANQFPQITFKGKLTETGDDEYTARGKLTLRGIAREVEAKFKIIGSAAEEGKTRTGLEGTLTINRHDFGVDYGKGVLGANVTLWIAVEGLK